jgi:hypothetical protein
MRRKKARRWKRIKGERREEERRGGWERIERKRRKGESMENNRR